MRRYYLDDKRRKGSPFLVHREHCLFRRDDSVFLGKFSWDDQAAEAALTYRRNIARCKLCCPWRLPGSKKRRTAFYCLTERIARPHR
jgi:hypothetical protein